MIDAPSRNPRRRQARGQQRMQQLLDVAAQVFAEVGFEAATTNGIAARAGLSPGSLYQFEQHEQQSEAQERAHSWKRRSPSELRGE